MSDIPERGYGNWRQWKRRVERRRPPEHPAFAFFITGTMSQAEIDAWVRRHTASPIRDGTKQEATEAQR